MRVLLRPTAEPSGTISESRPIDFHRRLPGYDVTPLVGSPRLAEALGVGEVYIKDETARFGLPSFKVLGASWATYVALCDRLGPLPDGPISHQKLRTWAAPLRPLTLLAATDGNHGRGVARVASWFGLDARIYVPCFVSKARIEAIESEGAEVIAVDGFYDDSVDAALEASKDDKTLLISDTARSVSDVIPRLVTDGYTTTFAEVDQQLLEQGDDRIDVVSVQAGVGGLSCACTNWARLYRKGRSPRVAVAEPETAACVMTALAAGEPVGIAADEISAMNVLQCGTVSLTAFETLKAGVSCCLAVEDDWARIATNEIRASGVDTGLSGAAGMAGLIGAMQGPMAGSVREHLALTSDSRILVVATEAATASALPAADAADALDALTEAEVPAE